MPSALGLVQHEMTFFRIDERHITSKILGKVMENPAPSNQGLAKDQTCPTYFGVLPLLVLLRKLLVLRNNFF